MHTLNISYNEITNMPRLKHVNIKFLVLDGNKITNDISISTSGIDNVLM